MGDENLPKKRGTRGHPLKQPNGSAEGRGSSALASSRPPDKDVQVAKDSNQHGNSSRPSTFDVCLLLRAHAEARWLSNELAPVLREIEQRETISDQQLGAALAYLEVLWMEACARARETESARVELDALGSGEPSLPE